jgi:hypothetical protein
MVPDAPFVLGCDKSLFLLKFTDIPTITLRLEPYIIILFM